MGDRVRHGFIRQVGLFTVDILAIYSIESLCSVFFKSTAEPLTDSPTNVKYFPNGILLILVFSRNPGAFRRRYACRAAYVKNH